MSTFDWIRFLPFALTALVLLGWALIQILQTRRDEYDLLTVCIITVGIGTALYIGSLAVNYSVVEVSWPSWYYDTLRVVLGISAGVGLWPTWRNVYRAWLARRRDQTRDVTIYDVPQDERGA